MIGNYYFRMGMCKVVFAAIDVLSIKCTLYFLWLRKTVHEKKQWQVLRKTPYIYYADMFWLYAY